MWTSNSRKGSPVRGTEGKGVVCGVVVNMFTILLCFSYTEPPICRKLLNCIDVSEQYALVHCNSLNSLNGYVVEHSRSKGTNNCETF